MKGTNRLEIKAHGACEIVMTRTFDAPRSLVFEAWTRPELVRRWMLGPEGGGWTMPLCEIDLRVGGLYRFVWRKESDGTEMKMGGTYREIVPGERIVSSETFDEPWHEGGAISTLVLTERDGVTTATQWVLYDSTEIRDAVLASPMESGLSAGFNRLDRIFAEIEPEAIDEGAMLS